VLSENGDIVISRGQNRNIFLYELTEQDLLDSDLPSSYRVGNVLIFAERQNARIGRELARADDLLAAWEFLDGRQLGAENFLSSVSQRSTAATAAVQDSPKPPNQEVEALSSDVAQLTLRIEQRDELLRDISESLKAQKEENELLSLLLEQSETRLAVDELSRNELMEDLQEVSAHTMTVETTLERVLEEKSRLEQELAEKATELVEISLINDSLRSRLAEHDRTSRPEQATLDQPATTSSLPTAEVFGGWQPSAKVADSRPPHPETAEPQTLTMASGKQIHVYHQFPELPKPSLPSRAKAWLGNSLRVAGVLALSALTVLAGSVLATSAVNHVSFGNALDLLLKSLDLLR